jgi:3-isopropylmalate/(R)-2-methylmalate dehydratase small subunit
MEKFEKFSGIAAPMPLVNIDTDMIIPKAIFKNYQAVRPWSQLHLLKCAISQDGSEVEDFVLNKPAYRDSSILGGG